jgi:hypothetical protein
MYFREIGISRGTARKPMANALATTGTHSNGWKNAF